MASRPQTQASTKAAAVAAAPPTGGTRSRTAKTECELSNRSGKTQAKSKTPKVPLEKAGSPPPVPQADPPGPKAKRASRDSAPAAPAATPGTPRTTRDVSPDTVSDQPAPWRLSRNVAHIASGGFSRPRPRSSTRPASPELDDILDFEKGADHRQTSFVEELEDDDSAGSRASTPSVPVPEEDDPVEEEDGGDCSDSEESNFSTTRGGGRWW
ncbi:hypothetical protein FB451DRAFT_1411845 [Mycena latifolia]|nr:hypothetical protein FB451DRAFT_1411845 [Mycena latifolia]